MQHDLYRFYKSILVQIKNKEKRSDLNAIDKLFHQGQNGKIIKSMSLCGLLKLAQPITETKEYAPL